MAKNLILVFASIAISVGLLLIGTEIYAQYFYRSGNYISWYDEAIRLRASGKDVVPWVNSLRNHGPKYWTGTIPNELNVSGGETGEYTVWRADPNGFKNPYARFEQDGAFDVFSVGDSFSMSRSLPMEDSWHRILESQYGLKSYSLAVGGTGSFTALTNVYKYLPQRKVKYLVYGFYANDFSDTQREATNAKLQELISFVDTGQQIPEAPQAEVDSWKGRLVTTLTKREQKKLKFEFKSAKLVQRVFAVNTDGDKSEKRKPPTEAQRELVEMNLRKISLVASTNRTRLIILHFPRPEDFDDSAFSHPEARSIVLSGFCAELRCDYIDMYSVFRLNSAHPLEDYYINVLKSGTFGHFNKQGALLVASTIGQHIKRLNQTHP